MKSLIVCLLFIPALSMAAAPKSAKQLKPVKTASLKGLSAFTSFDLADSMSFDRTAQNNGQSGTFGAERAVGFGAEYLVTTFENGLGVVAGGTFEMGRTLSKESVGSNTASYTGAKPEVQLWTAYGQGVALLTDKISVLGGANYSLPQVKNIANGTWKGQFGYQFGGSYQYSNNIAFDGLYRVMNFSGDVSNQGVSTSYSKISLSGITLRARYIF